MSVPCMPDPSKAWHYGTTPSWDHPTRACTAPPTLRPRHTVGPCTSKAVGPSVGIQVEATNMLMHTNPRGPLSRPHRPEVTRLGHTYRPSPAPRCRSRGGAIHQEWRAPLYGVLRPEPSEIGPSPLPSPSTGLPNRWVSALYAFGCNPTVSTQDHMLGAITHEGCGAPNAGPLRAPCRARAHKRRRPGGPPTYTRRRTALAYTVWGPPCKVGGEVPPFLATTPSPPKTRTRHEPRRGITQP